MTQAQSLLQVLLAVYNALLLLVGMTFMTVGVLFLARLRDDAKLYGIAEVMGLQPFAVGFIIVGGLMIVACVLGCVSAILELHILSLTYALLMLFLLLITVVLSIQVYQIPARAIDTFKIIPKEARGLSKGTTKIPNLSRAKDFDYFNSTDDFIATHGVQIALRCCGKKGPGDYRDLQLPRTCCPLQMKQCTENDAYPEGCEVKLREAFNKYADYVGYSCLAIILFQFVGFLFASFYATLLYSFDPA